MMKNKRKEWKRIVAFTLAALLTANSIDLSVFTAYAKEAAEQTEEVNETNAVLTITGFADLEESIVNQQLAIGALEEEVVFPDTLEVTVSVSDAKTKEAETEEAEETAETETEETTDSETEETEETEEETAETEEAETANGETAETEETETTEGKTEETETTGGEATKTGESESQEPENEVNKSVQEADENTSQNTESENSSTEADMQEQKEETDTASLMDAIGDSFRVNLYRPSYGETPKSSSKGSLKSSSKDLNSTQQKIVELIQENPKITQAEMAEVIEISKRAIQKSIKEMVDADIIEREGSSRKGCWKIKE